MAHYEFYPSDAPEIPLTRKWLLRGLVLSLLLHIGLIAFFHLTKLETFDAPSDKQLAPPVRVLSDVKIPAIPEDTILHEPMGKAPVVPIPLETTKPELQIVHIAPHLSPEITQSIVRENSQIEGGNAFAKIQIDSVGGRDESLNNTVEVLLERSALANDRLLLNEGRGGDGGVKGMIRIPGLRSIDDALTHTGPLPVDDQPIGMPGGALYEYNSYDLLPEAQYELRKLGELINRNPRATFSIEGHTDSTGTPEYNQVLSEKRAESVKLWLVQFMGIAPERIHTKGLGSTQLIVPADRSVEEQQPNRRVEIVIKTKP